MNINHKARKNFAILDTFIDSISIVNNFAEIIFTNKAWQQFSIANNGDFQKTDCGINYLKLCNNVIGDDQEQQNAIEAAKGIQKVIKRETTLFEMEYPCHSKDEQRWFIIRAMPLSNESDLTMISHLNVTQRRLAEEEVKEKNRKLKIINERLDSTMYKIVHDIQGPLNSIEGLLDLTKIEEEDQMVNPYFSILKKSILNLKTYIQDTLKMTTLELNVIDFQHIINEYLESIKFSSVLKFINIEVNVIQKNNFYSNKSELSSIISNIINNSLKYYDREKKENYVLINIQVTEIEAIISIKDNGIGISQEMIPKIFNLSFQINKDSNSGAGLGLYMVQKAVKQLNGKIKVSSNLGKGTEFSIIIPNLQEIDE